MKHRNLNNTCIFCIVTQHVNSCSNRLCCCAEVTNLCVIWQTGITCSWLPCVCCGTLALIWLWLVGLNQNQKDFVYPKGAINWRHVHLIVLILYSTYISHFKHCCYISLSFCTGQGPCCRLKVGLAAYSEWGLGKQLLFPVAGVSVL